MIPEYFLESTLARVISHHSENPTIPIFRFLEIGTASGLTTNNVVNLLKKKRPSNNFEVYACDPFLSYWEKNRDEEKTLRSFLERNRESIEKNLVFFERKTSEEYLNYLRQEKGPDFFDVIYIDGAHDAFSVIKDFILADSLLKTSGVIVFDDYNWISRKERANIRNGSARHPALSPAASIDFVKNILTLNYSYVLLNGVPYFIKF